MAALRFITLAVILLGARAQAPDEDAAREWLVEYNNRAMEVNYEDVLASWNYNTNITDENQDISIQKSAVVAAFDKEAALNASAWNHTNFQDYATKREFGKIVDLGTAVLDVNDYNKYNSLGANLSRIYNTATVCNRPGDSSGTCYPLDPDLTQIVASSRDWNELVWAWQGWRNESGRKMPDTYEEFIQLQNKAATLNNYDDGGAYWRSWYEMDNLREDCERLWNQTRPLYEQLHTYVRRRLRETYVNNTNDFPASGHIPAHILGNMWAQSWTNIENIVRPFPDKPGFDVTDEMVNQGYTPTRMFELSEEFFTSLDLIPMPERFWNFSMIVRPPDRQVACHASAWDFLNQKDFRIKQCTEVNHNWLIVTHHEMGHVEYFLQYKDHPVKFRTGANPGFHEAIGDVMSLSVNTPEHLNKIGLLPSVSTDPEEDLNFLMNQALSKIVFIPFGYLIDQWRWDIFSGDTTKDQYNRDWWRARCLYQGVSPPVPRSNQDFDAGAKYHVPANTPYIRYFVSHIIQFQFHQALCNASGWTGPLHRCDIYESKEAGQLIGNMMKLGASLPWPEAMNQIAGTRQMDAAPVIDYFQPLLDWLIEQNSGDTIGWTPDCPNMPQ